jgi:outer membrane receptor protein involved in Fe transport
MNRSILLRFPFLLVIILSGINFAGVTGKISGKVSDAQTGEELIGINIIIEGTTQGAATGVDGTYIINNVEAGTYNLIFSGVGYQKKIVANVIVSSDFTTNINVQLSTEAVGLEPVVVQAEKPLVRKDLTSSQVTIDANQIDLLPVENVTQILTLQAGITQDAGGSLHIKGGRESEISYNVNGVSIVNPYDNSRSVIVPTNAIQELSVVSGTFNAEYGNALSGIINSNTKEGSSSYTGSFSYYTGDYITSRKNIFFNIDDINPVNHQVAEFTLGGPIPMLGDLLTFFLSGRYDDDRGYLYGIRQHNPTDYIIYPGTDSMIVQATGDGKIVSMNPDRTYSTNAKLTLKPSSIIKINYDFLYTDSKYQNYIHDMKYNPDANYRRFSRGLFNSLELRHVLSNSTFYSLKGSHNISDYKRYLYPLLDAAGNEADISAGDDIAGLAPDQRYQNTTRSSPIAENTFSSGGTLNEHLYQMTRTYGAKLDLVSQLNLNHELKFGSEYKYHILDLEDFTVIRDNDNTLPYIPLLSTSQHEKYSRNPVEFSTYIQDKMEYSTMIINVGVRFDYFDPNAKYSSNTTYPSPNDPSIPSNIDKNSILKDAEVKYQVSPRVGISFPITDKGIIHFSYGHFFQIPNFTYLYRNPDFKYQASGTPSFGNANLNPEKTITYEIGLQQQLLDNLSFDITGYVKDVRDLLAQQEIQAQLGKSYIVWINKDYGNIKGVTFSLRKRRDAGDLFGATLDYTYQSTEGSDTRGASSNAAFFDLSSGRQSEKEPYLLDWDRTHTLNATLNFGGELWNATFVGRLGSGLPYSPDFVDKPIYFKRNSDRRPSQMRVDLLLDKTFRMFDISLIIFFKIFNLFDTLNENSVYLDTGRAGYSLAEERGTTELAQRYSEENPLIKSPDEYLIRPDYYLSPREVRLGISLEF